jgi:hypothetical protein
MDYSYSSFEKNIVNHFNRKFITQQLDGSSCGLASIRVYSWSVVSDIINEAVTVQV